MIWDFDKIEKLFVQIIVITYCLIVSQMNSIAPLAVRKNYLGVQQPERVAKQIIDVANRFGDYKLNTSYQRENCWNQTTKNGLISSIMENKLIPEIILYKIPLSDRQSDERHLYEVIDGQHRLSTIYSFMNPSGNDIVYWEHKDVDNNDVAVFYSINSDVMNYCHRKKIQYFTELPEDCKEDFNEFSLGLRIIKTSLTYEERANIFMNLQNGVKVRNSDYSKNAFDCTFIKMLTQTNLREIIESKNEGFFNKNCVRKAPKYWTNWTARCFFLFIESKKRTKEPAKQFLIKDSTINHLIKTSHKKLNQITEIEFNNFNDKFRTYKCFVESIIKNKMLNPTQIFALFYSMCLQTNDKIEFILTNDEYKQNFNRVIFNESFYNGNKKFKTLWEGKDKNDMREEYFIMCVETFNTTFSSYNSLMDEEEIMIYQEIEDEDDASVCSQSTIATVLDDEYDDIDDEN